MLRQCWCVKLSEVSGKAVCTCPQCGYEFEQEVTIDVDPDTFRDDRD